MSPPWAQAQSAAGYLSTTGNQIVTSSGTPVRLACTGYFGYPADHPRAPSLADDLAAMKADGFNCLRIQYHDATLASDLKMIDATVAAAAGAGLMVIIDHHLNEAGNDCNHYSQQKNGLWFDLGPGTDDTDGCQPGTVTAQRFQDNWVSIARRYAGNPAVIGFDLDNEPIEMPLGAHWGGGGPTDIQAAYTAVGNAIQRVNPDALIICEGPIRWAPLYSQDLTGVKTLPVTLGIPHKVVYSVHLYPSAIGAEPVDSGRGYITDMNTAWGYLVTQGIAAVWIGEMGASLDGNTDSSGGKLAAEQAWAATVVPYLNGQDGDMGGPVFQGGSLPIGTDWWAWGNLDGEEPDGTLDGHGAPRPQQRAVYGLLQPLPPSP